MLALVSDQVSPSWSVPTPFPSVSSVNAAIAAVPFHPLGDLPDGLTFTLAGPVNEVVGWMAIHLHFISS